MFVRASRAEIDFYLNNLRLKGFVTEKVDKLPKSTRITLKSTSTGELKIITFTGNGWMLVE